MYLAFLEVIKAFSNIFIVIIPFWIMVVLMIKFVRQDFDDPKW